MLQEHYWILGQGIKNLTALNIRQKSIIIISETTSKCLYPRSTCWPNLKFSWKYYEYKAINRLSPNTNFIATWPLCYSNVMATQQINNSSSVTKNNSKIYLNITQSRTLVFTAIYKYLSRKCSRQWKPWTHPLQGSSKIRRHLDVKSWGV